MTAEEIGNLALETQRTRRVVERWMDAEGKRGHLVQAGQCEHYAAHREAAEKLRRAVTETVDAEEKREAQL